MNFEILKNTEKLNLSSYQGYVITNYNDLVEKFGLPLYGPHADIDGKVTCEWCIEFGDGSVASIYDWKTGGTPLGEYEWHIGGFTDEVVEHVQSMLHKSVTMKKSRTVV